MTPPKAVVFDLGKVLLDFDYSLAARNLLARATATLDDIRAYLDHSPLLVRFETGAMDGREFFEEVRAFSGFQGTFDEFSHGFSNIFSPIEPMVELHGQLRSRGVPVYVFSNTNDIQITHIRKHFPFYSSFDGYVLSFEHQCMKPHEKIYQVVEKLTGALGSDLLYLDDRAENVRAGQERGWRAHVHSNPAQTREIIRQSGLLLD